MLGMLDMFLEVGTILNGTGSFYKIYLGNLHYGTLRVKHPVINEYDREIGEGCGNNFL